MPTRINVKVFERNQHLRGCIKIISYRNKYSIIIIIEEKWISLQKWVHNFLRNIAK